MQSFHEIAVLIKTLITCVAEEPAPVERATKSSIPGNSTTSTTESASVRERGDLVGPFTTKTLINNYGVLIQPH